MKRNKIKGHAAKSREEEPKALEAKADVEVRTEEDEEDEEEESTEDDESH